MKRLILATAMMMALAGVCHAQSIDPRNPFSSGERLHYVMVRTNVVRSAEKMPEEYYAFRPTPEVRTFGQILAHIADTQYTFCSAVAGTSNPAPHIEKTKTSKSDLVQAIKDSFAYCDPVYNGLVDAQAGATVTFFGSDMPKLTLLTLNSSHGNEHYGNIVTYLRIKGIVPPSSEPKQ